MTPRLAAVILAGGLSSRMGDFKPLLPLEGRSALAWCVEAFRRAGVETIAVVAGHRADEVRAEAKRLGIACLFNPDYRQGMFTSLKTGLAALSPRPDGVFVLPVDIPLVRPVTISRLIRAFAGDMAIHPTLGGKRGHPPLLPGAWIERILDFSGAGGLRAALEELEARHGGLDVPVADENILHDQDHPHQYRQAQVRASRLGRPSAAETEALLTMYAMPPRGLAHARAVARAALALAWALNDAGRHPPLDLELTENAALLHDMAKGRKNHEAEGGRLLDEAGFPDAAAVVRAHRDIDLPPDQPVTEREVVYLADKLASGDRMVDVAARFQEKLDRFAADPEAVAAITGRRDRALAMRARIEAETGLSLGEILARGCLRTRPGTAPDRAGAPETGDTPAPVRGSSTAAAPQGAADPVRVPARGSAGKPVA
ncbi:NTP transferase domain-containing protein [Fundidesulfovibrio butyratiphilus]